MTDEPSRRRRPVPASVDALNAATLAFNEAVMAFCREPDYLELMRQQLRSFSPVPLLVMASRPFGHVWALFPELVLNLCQGSASSIDLARNVIRTLPKSEVERRVVADLEPLVEGMTADELAQLADLLIEMGLAGAVERVRTYAAEQVDDEMRELADDLDGVEGSWRWRLSRAERIDRR